MKRTLIIAAHPDDDILGCGGMIAKYQPKGVMFKILYLGEGSTCRFDDVTDPLAVEAIRARRDAAMRATALLGVSDLVFHDLPCGRFDQVPILSINKIIEQEIRSFLPDTIFTHASRDANNDHKIVANATLMATRPGAQNHVARLFAYEVLSSSEWAFLDTFCPNYFEQLSEDAIAKKWKALSCYETEIREYPFPRSREGLRAHAMMRGMQAGYAYAEAFQLIREFKA